MNNSWNDQQYSMMNMPMMNPSMGMGPVPPLAPSMFMANEFNEMNVGNDGASQQNVSQPGVNNQSNKFIGPVVPESLDNLNAEDMQVQDNNFDEKDTTSRSRRNDSRDRNRNGRRDRDDRGDRNKRRSRSPRRNRNGRHGDRNRSDNDRNDRRGRWGGSDGPQASMETVGYGMPNMPNMMLPGNMMGFGNQIMPGQGAGMANMGNMAPGMPMTGMMPGMGNMMPGMGNMMGMSNMTHDQNNMVSNAMIMPFMRNQPVYLTSVALLPAIPGTELPPRRQRPSGCRTILVGGLPSGIDEDVIQEIFHRFGEIVQIKLHRQGICHIRFASEENVESAFMVSGYRFKYHEQMDTEATTIFIDYTVHRDDHADHNRPTPPKVEPYSPAALTAVAEKMKSDENFAEAASSLAVWLERGECNKRNSASFYSMVQSANNQLRRLFSEKMALDEEFNNFRTTMKEKFDHVIYQFEQVAKILSAAKHQRVSDHFSKQQRRNIEMWLKMTEELENIKEEYKAAFDDEETEIPGRRMIVYEKYEELKMENENLMCELEGYKNEAHLAKDEAERKFEKFKAHYIAQTMLQTKQQVYPPLPSPPKMPVQLKPGPPPPTPDDHKVLTSGLSVPPTEAKLISILTAFLMVHPLGASSDYLVSYVRSMTPNVTQATVSDILNKYPEVFQQKTSGVGASMENRWCYATFDIIKGQSG